MLTASSNDPSGTGLTWAATGAGGMINFGTQGGTSINPTRQVLWTFQPSDPAKGPWTMFVKDVLFTSTHDSRWASATTLPYRLACMGSSPPSRNSAWTSSRTTGMPEPPVTAPSGMWSSCSPGLAPSGDPLDSRLTGRQQQQMLEAKSGRVEIRTTGFSRLHQMVPDFSPSRLHK